MLQNTYIRDCRWIAIHRTYANNYAIINKNQYTPYYNYYYRFATSLVYSKNSKNIKLLNKIIINNLILNYYAIIIPTTILQKNTFYVF